MCKKNIFITYNYRVYGLKIKSEIPMSELITIDEAECIYPDVSISYGLVPKCIENPRIDGKYMKMNDREFYLHIKDIAHYYVADGKRIIIESEIESDIEQVKIFLLGTCFGILLKQRNIIAIHGGAIVINGHGIIITGHTGAGKSTLTSALREEGFSFLADDVSALGNDLKGDSIIYPTYPQQKLCRDAMMRMNYDTSKFKVIDASRGKYAIPLTKSFLSFPTTLKSIYEVNTCESSSVEITELFGNEKIKTILRNIYRVEVIGYLGFEPLYFKKCVEIAKTVSVYKIRRPNTGVTVSEQIQLIKNTLKEIELNSI